MPARARPVGRTAAVADADLPRRVPSFADFVDDALFHPRWGYYSTGGVRFGTGGHFDTYPLALSPLFGHMVAQYAFAAWRRAGSPDAFEVCELGAGNGQLCLDTLLWVAEHGRHKPAWKRFAQQLRYRILERSPALIARQRQHLGPVAESVRWSRTDLARSNPRAAPFATAGVIVANEVLDCLPHHQIVFTDTGRPSVVFVVPELNGRRLDRAGLAAAMAHAERRRRVRFREVLLPLERVPGLAAFVRRHYPERCAPSPRRPPYFACPRIEPLMRHAARLYERADALWIDYGETRDFHLRAPASRRLFAGPPRSGAGVYDDPGRDDITFMVDFSVATRAARAAGWRVVHYGPQADLARRTRVALDREAIELIVRHRALGWMLALAGVGPERAWQRGGVSWSRAPRAGHVPVRRYVEQSVREFGAGRRATFKLLILRR
jgi:SAM-dependent MidA family methyltransferase